MTTSALVESDNATEDSSDIVHTVRWVIRHNRVCAYFDCLAEEGSWCRLGCSAQCDNDPDCSHERTDRGECTVVAWLENDAEGTLPEEVYAGPEVPIRDGRILPMWNGAGYDWMYW